MDVDGPQFQGLGQNLIHEADDGGILGRRRKIQIIVLVLDDFDAIDFAGHRLKRVSADAQ